MQKIHFVFEIHCIYLAPEVRTGRKMLCTNSTNKESVVAVCFNF